MKIELQLAAPKPAWKFPCFIRMKASPTQIYWAMKYANATQTVAVALVAYGTDTGLRLNNCQLDFYEPVPDSAGLVFELSEAGVRLLQGPPVVEATAEDELRLERTRETMVPTGATFPYLGENSRGRRILFLCREQVPGRELFAGGWFDQTLHATGSVSRVHDRCVSDYKKVSGQVAVQDRGEGQFPQVWNWLGHEPCMLLRTAEDTWFWINPDGSGVKRSKLATAFFLVQPEFCRHAPGTTIKFSL